MDDEGKYLERLEAKSTNFMIVWQKTLDLVILLKSIAMALTTLSCILLGMDRACCFERYPTYEPGHVSR